MPRTHRIQNAGTLHHIVTRGNNKENIFHSTDDFIIFLNFLESSRKKFPLKIYNFVLMNNHLHLLAEPGAEYSLSQAMEMVLKNYAKYFNGKYDHAGHVFQGRFKNFVIQSERYFFNCCRYIDLNPIKAKIVKVPEDYPWSGHEALSRGRKSPLVIDHHELYLNLGNTPRERQTAYRAIILKTSHQEIDWLNRRSGIMGDKKFRATLKSKVAPFRKKVPATSE